MPTIPKTFDKDVPRWKKNKNDTFYTPLDFARAALQFEVFDNIFSDNILDPGCGTGVWGTAIKEKWPDSYLTGVDIDLPIIYDHRDPGYMPQYNETDRGDYLKLKFFSKYDLILGNPPFSAAGDKRLAEKFVIKSLDLLEDHGILGFILKTEFLASQIRFENLWKVHRPTYILQSVDRINWTNYKKGVNTIEYCFMIFQKNIPDKRPEVVFMNWKNVKKVEFL